MRRIMSDRMAGMAHRRSLATAVWLTAVLCPPTPHARADDYPSRAITLIVPYPAGGGVDAMARLVASKLSAPLGQQVIVDNRGGGGGNIGARAVAKAAPDGYTLLLGGAGSVTINPSLDPNSGYTARDFAPIGRIASMPVVITVHPSLAVHSVADLIALAKRQAGKLNVGTPNRGSGAYLAAELFKAMAGVELTLIPYKGAAHQRSPRRPYRDRFQHHPARARQHSIGQPASDRGDQRNADEPPPRRADSRGIRAAGVRGHAAFRAARASRHAAIRH